VLVAGNWRTDWETDGRIETIDTDGLTGLPGPPAVASRIGGESRPGELVITILLDPEHGGRARR